MSTIVHAAVSALWIVTLALGVADIPLAISAEIGVASRIAKLPYAVLLEEHGVIAAQGLVNTRAKLESRFEARRLSVAIGAEHRTRQVGVT